MVAEVGVDVVPVRRRRWPRRVLIGVGLLVLLMVVGSLWMERLTFPYEGPDRPVAAGSTVTIVDPDGPCGPLITSIWRPSGLGQWDQTHNGDAISDAFAPDPHSWWRFLESETYDTPVPCPLGGRITFTLPDDVQPGTIALCDTDRHCARVTVSEP